MHPGRNRCQRHKLGRGHLHDGKYERAITNGRLSTAPRLNSVGQANLLHKQEPAP